MDVVFEYADVGGAWLVENAPGVGEAIRMYEHLPGAMERASEGMANLVSEGWGAVPTKAMEGLVVDVSKAALDQDTLTALGWTYARIMAAVSLLCILFHLPMVLYKLKLYGQGMLHLLFSTDKKFKPYSTHVPESEESFTPYREIIFVRHGESTWNDTFNRSKNPIYFIPRLVKAWAYETWLFLSGREDSWFYDSPLSDHGTGQAESLAQFLDEFTPGASSPAQVKYVNVLKGKSTPAVHVVSNLRRAISTNAIGLRGRLAATGEKMLILPALQEISRNIDTLSLTPPGEHPAPSWIDERNPNVNIPAILENHIDPSLHTGNKAVRSCGLDRLVAFCDWAFEQKAFNVVVGGHSLWFRAFFNSFLPSTSSFVGKTSKLHNAGCVGFTLLRLKDAAGNPMYLVDEASITEIFRGFDVKK